MATKPAVVVGEVDGTFSVVFSGHRVYNGAVESYANSLVSGIDCMIKHIKDPENIDGPAFSGGWDPVIPTLPHAPETPPSIPPINPITGGDPGIPPAPPPPPPGDVTMFNGDHWVAPAGVTVLATVECWGPAHTSGIGSGSGSAAGGGGGGYSKDFNIAVTPAGTYTPNFSGHAQFVGDAVTVRAMAGLGPTGSGGVIGGLGAPLTGALGAIKFPGGDGADTDGGFDVGGGGGGGAGPGGAGGNASGQTGGLGNGGIGGLGDGGAGSNIGVGATSGSAPNGAQGGHGRGAGNSAGLWEGKVRITWL